MAKKPTESQTSDKTTDKTSKAPTDGGVTTSKPVAEGVGTFSNQTQEGPNSVKSMADSVETVRAGVQDTRDQKPTPTKLGDAMREVSLTTLPGLGSIDTHDSIQNPATLGEHWTPVTQRPGDGDPVKVIPPEGDENGRRIEPEEVEEDLDEDDEDDEDTRK